MSTLAWFSLIATSLALGGLRPAIASPPAAREAPMATESVDRLAGSFRFAGGGRERAARDAAIDQVVDEMSFLVRGIARKRLREANRIRERVAISRQGDKLTVRLDGETFTAPINGPAVDVVARDGMELKLRYRIAKGRIEQTLQAEEGGRTNHFEVDGKGRLTVRVRIFSEKLPKDVRYRLTYAR
ncbi:MAG TPA: hypothetical protein VFB62_16260 [Polyangiaceae bacterium]|jgi:hypothetical protein|nr:hypothetical protein [Polyangiaceae bacterium]